MPELSVIIPVFNRQRQAESAIASVLAQGLDCEIVVVDDGSNPAFLLPPSLSHANVRLLRHDRNQGAAAARNTGICKARADYLSFLDSDDCLLPGTLERRLVAARRAELGTAHGDAIVTGCGWTERFEGDKRETLRIPKAANFHDAYLGGCWVAPGSCIIARRTVFTEQVGLFDASLRRLEDVDWFIRFGRAGGELNIHTEPCVSIRNHHNKCGRQISDAADHLIQKHGPELSRQQMRLLRSYLLLERAGVEKRAGRFAAMFYNLAVSWLVWPRWRLHLAPGWHRSVGATGGWQKSGLELSRPTPGKAGVVPVSRRSSGGG